MLFAVFQTGEAADRIFSDNARMRRYFEKTGSLMTADGSDDHLIKPQGAGDDYSFSMPLPELPAAAAQPIAIDVEPANDASVGDGKEEKKGDAKAKSKPKSKSKRNNSSSSNSPSANADDDEDSSSEYEDDEDEIDDADALMDSDGEPDPEEESTTVAEALPENYQANSNKPRALTKALVKKPVLFKFSAVGWQLARIWRFYNPPVGAEQYNYELLYDADDRRDHCLDLARYGCADDAKPGAWTLLEKIR